MTDCNNVVIIGRLTADATYSMLPSGMGVLNFSIANGRSYKKGDEWVNDTSYFNCVSFSKYAEEQSKKLLKGTMVCVTGSLKQDRWEKDGQKYSVIKIVAESIQNLGASSSAEKKTEKPVTPEEIAEVFNGAVEENNREIPF